MNREGCVQEGKPGSVIKAWSVDQWISTEITWNAQNGGKVRGLSSSGIRQTVLGTSSGYLVLITGTVANRGSALLSHC